MAKKTLYFLGLALTLIIGAFIYWKVCCSTCNIGASKLNTDADMKVNKKVNISKPEIVVNTTSPLAIKDANGEFEYNSNDNFNFNPSSFSILQPINDSVQVGIGKIKAYLENPSKIIDIKGYYSSSETNNSAFPNLGIARANEIKNYFVSKGISSKQINVDGALNHDLIVKDNIYIGPLSFNIETANEDASNNKEEELKALGKKIKDNPLVLYFNSGQSSINLTSEQRLQIADLSNYLDKVDDASCLITGHTDNTGKRTTNIRLGKERADFAKGYLVQNGIPANKIKTSSNGPDSPIATNATKKGRAKNRRTVVTIN